MTFRLKMLRRQTAEADDEENERLDGGDDDEEEEDQTSTTVATISDQDLESRIAPPRYIGQLVFVDLDPGPLLSRSKRSSPAVYVPAVRSPIGR